MVRTFLCEKFFRVAAAIACMGLLPISVCAQTGAAPAHPRATSSPHGSFLVFPFENVGAGARLDWLSEGLEELTLQKLSDSGEQIFSHDARVSQLERFGLPGSAKFSRATMLRLAQELDADFVVFGSFTYDGNILGVQARVLRVSPAALLPAAHDSGLLDTLIDLQTRVVWRLLSALDTHYTVSLAEFSRGQKNLRLDAFEHYVRGLMATAEEPRTRELREAARLEPDWPEPAFALGQLAFTKRDCPTAIAWFSRVPSSHDRYMEAMFSTGVCRLWTNEPDRAEATFLSLQATIRHASSEAADLPELLNDLAIAQARQGKGSQAKQDFTRAADLDPEESDFPFNLGWLALRANDFSSAEAAFHEALQREPEDTEARALLIYALERAGKKSEAQAERAAAAALPHAAPLPAVHSESLAELGRIVAELDVTTLQQETEWTNGYSKSAASASATASADHVKLGRQELSAGNLADGEREFRAALAQDARDSAAHRGLAEVLRRQGKLDDAIGELKASIEARDSATTRTALARIYLEQKKPDLAMQEAERALQLAPNYAPAKQLLQRLEPPKPGSTTP